MKFVKDNYRDMLVVVKNYEGSQEGATKLFQKDAIEMAEQGYFPTSQSYAPGTYGCISFLGALILCFVLVGILIFIYMLVVKPDGTLSVTYELDKQKLSRQMDSLDDGSCEAILRKAQNQSQTSFEEKTCPKCAEQVKAAAIICRFCNHRFEPSLKG